MIRKRPELLSPFVVGLVLYQAKMLFSPVGIVLGLILTVVLVFTIRGLGRKTL